MDGSKRNLKRTNVFKLFQTPKNKVRLPVIKRKAEKPARVKRFLALHIILRSVPHIILRKVTKTITLQLLHLAPNFTKVLYAMETKKFEKLLRKQSNGVISMEKILFQHFWHISFFG